MYEPPHPVSVMRSVKLRTKLILAFVGMAAMAGLCGIVGLLFVHRIAGTVSFFADVTSPLLTESMALTENARQMRSSVFRVVLGGETIADFDEQFLGMRQSRNEHLKTLRDLAAQIGFEGNLDASGELGDGFVDTLNRILLAFQRQKSAIEILNQRGTAHETLRTKINAKLTESVKRAEATVTEAAEEIRLEMQASPGAPLGNLANRMENVLADAFPVAQNANKLLQEFDRLEQLIQPLLSRSGPSNVSGIEEEVEASFKASDALWKNLGERAPHAGTKTDLSEIIESYGELRSSIRGPSGLIGSQREVQAARTDLIKERAKLDRLDAAYFATLQKVKAAVTDLNGTSRLRVEAGIMHAGSLVSGTILVVVLTGVIFGLFFANRLTAPVVRLAEHARRIRESGELRPLADGIGEQASDEIGVLTQSFNRMVEELGETRKRLIAWSEAEVRKQYERLNSAIHNMPQGLCMFDADQKLIICNRRYAEMYSIPDEHLCPGTPLRTILELRVKAGIYTETHINMVEERITATSEGKPWYSVNELCDGRVIAVTHQPMATGGSVATHEDITERRRAEAQLEFLAHHDALTKLPNRMCFRDEMAKALSRADREDGQVAVLCLDLDHFKAVNDTLGHPVGDALLQEVAKRIRDCVRAEDTAARLGGDEFAVVQHSVEQPVGATTLAARLIETISGAYEVLGHQVVVGSSVGIAISPLDGKRPDDLLKNADMALYRAKEDGRGIYRFFEPEMDAKMQARRALELELRKAMVCGEFELNYQPLVRLDTNRVSAFEALLRWRHPDLGMIPPANFIPLAEEIGLITAIGSWVLKEACKVAAGWPNDIRIAVNLSPVQFKGNGLVIDVLAALAGSGLAPGRLELEITESVLLQDTESTLATLNQLRAAGVRISMDDFGTGYSSLGYLRKFPFDKIKIDQSFIQDMSEKLDSVAIVRAVTGLGGSLGISTTAEGVETQEQLARLRDEGCTEIQGYLISRPIPASEIEALLDLRGEHVTQAAA